MKTLQIIEVEFFLYTETIKEAEAIVEKALEPYLRPGRDYDSMDRRSYQMWPDHGEDAGS